VADLLGQILNGHPDWDATLAISALRKHANNNVQIEPSSRDALALIQESREPMLNANSPLLRDLHSLDDPLSRTVAARALFERALSNIEESRRIRTILKVDGFSKATEPVTRLWSNRVLAMLDLADLAHLAAHNNVQSMPIKLRLDSLASADFFGDDFVWAATQASLHYPTR
jgi:hypothetical protein